MTIKEDSGDEGKCLLNPPETSADGSMEYSIDVEAGAALLDAVHVGMKDNVEVR
jgi:hypothetical protein